MTANSIKPGYSHTQKGPLCVILYAAAVACFALAWMVGSEPGMVVAFAVGIVLALLGSAVQHLTVEDLGDRVAIRFGPMPLFFRKVQYADINKAEGGRTLVIDSWGIHYSARGRWVWNLWGRDCVVVHLKNGGILRIGTDDGENRVRFLRQKVNELGG